MGGVAPVHRKQGGERSLSWVRSPLAGERTRRVAPRMRAVRLGVVIVDAHTDVVLELLVGEGEEPSLELVLRQGQDRLLERYWLPRLEAGGVGIQICPLYAAEKKYEHPRERVLAQEAEFRRLLDENA